MHLELHVFIWSCRIAAVKLMGFFLIIRTVCAAKWEWLRFFSLLFTCAGAHLAHLVPDDIPHWMASLHHLTEEAPPASSRLPLFQQLHMRGPPAASGAANGWAGAPPSSSSAPPPPGFQQTASQINRPEPHQQLAEGASWQSRSSSRLAYWTAHYAVNWSASPRKSNLEQYSLMEIRYSETFY